MVVAATIVHFLTLLLSCITAVILYNFRFGLSGAVGIAKQKTARKKLVYLDQKEICNMGRAEYLSDSRGIHRVSKSFQDGVLQLPLQYDMAAYMRFIEIWGTVSL